jgi:outer membrane receptor protein involved in Fe transport
VSAAAIRGVATTTTIDVGQGATGYFINDVPLSDPFLAVGIPDIDAFDVDNVSILRGPQGTLFGSASLGGAINYHTAAPDPSRFEGEVQGTFAGVDHGDAGGSGKVMVNLPLVSDVFAVRGVYTYRDDPGFIDNIGTHVEDSNSTVIRGGRLEAAWTPAAGTRLSYLFLDQSERTADLGAEQPVAAGLYEKQSLIPESADYTTLLHNLRFDQDLGFATLTATATYHKKTSYTDIDQTLAYGRLIPGVSPISAVVAAHSRGATVEVRLASPTDRPFQYLIGAMHDHTAERFSTAYEGAGASQSIEKKYAGLYGAGIGATAAPGDVFFSSTTPFVGNESALFGEGSYQFNDAWKLTLGGRAFHTTAHASSDSSGFFELLSVGTLALNNTVNASASGFTPKASITWTPTRDILTYFLVSKGFRFGGPNTNPSLPGSPIPSSYRPDSLINYELGVRTNWLDNRLQLDFTPFYIDWSNIQLSLGAANNLAYVTNAGKARSYGLESSATWHVVTGLNLQTNVTYLSSELTRDFVQGNGAPTVPEGTVLPGASRWQVSNLLSYQWVTGPLAPTAVLTHRFISQAPGGFPGNSGRPQGDYSLIDARLALHIHELTLAAFVDNIADRRGVTQASVVRSVLKEYLVHPRTIGININYKLREP